MQVQERRPHQSINQSIWTVDSIHISWGSGFVHQVKRHYSLKPVRALRSNITRVAAIKMSAPQVNMSSAIVTGYAQDGASFQTPSTYVHTAHLNLLQVFEFLHLYSELCISPGLQIAVQVYAHARANHAVECQGVINGCEYSVYRLVAHTNPTSYKRCSSSSSALSASYVRSPVLAMIANRMPPVRW